MLDWITLAVLIFIAFELVMVWAELATGRQDDTEQE